jgi:hypothetical protein
MFRPWPSSRRALVCLAASVALAGTACSRTSPTGPESSASTGRIDEAGRARASEAGAEGNQAPTAVFRTRPRADGDDVIVGGSSFDVTFNLCQSTDPDPGDELRFSYDFDGDGNVDELGHCRASHHYEVAAFASECATAVVCVTDRQPEHKICRRYDVCAFGRSREPAPSQSPGPELRPEQHIEGDLRPLASRDAWAFTGEPGLEVTLEVDTISSETAYLMQGCISTTNRWADCLKPQAKERVPCSYPPPGGLGCPHKTTVLPPSAGGDDVYYVIVGGLRFTQTPGAYTAVVRANPGIGTLALVVDNGDEEPHIEP